VNIVKYQLAVLFTIDT